MEEENDRAQEEDNYRKEESTPKSLTKADYLVYRIKPVSPVFFLTIY
jgi:hypothetical protein